MFNSGPREIVIPVDGVRLDGTLTCPDGATGLVLFAHGSGSSRLSPRNTAVAERLQRAGLATLLFDLLTGAEAQVRANVFDLSLLADRLLAATDWAARDSAAHDLPVGHFGASTGAGAALIAAARAPDLVRAVVARGGRPDLAHDWLARVRAPTLLIVGGNDTAVLGLNRMAYADLRCPKEFQVVPGAGHLFEEPGTMDVVCRLAEGWFRKYLRAPATAGR